MKSAKQKIVTKSSTEAELVALSDSANVPIHMSRFLAAQGHDLPSAILYQDYKSAMALIFKGRSTSDLTKHISLRYFWVKEKIEDGTVKIEFFPSLIMWANGLTKSSPSFEISRSFSSTRTPLIPEYLYMSNVFFAMKEKLYFKLKQINKNEYNWLTQEAIDKCKLLLDRYIENFFQFNFRHFIEILIF
jgi:hypothetical protein